MKKLLFALGLITAVANPLDACTGVTLTAQNGDTIYGRTMEWGTFALKSRICIYPRDFCFHAELRQENAGLNWHGRYGFVGIDALNRGFLLDGINEHGLTAGLFYHPGYATYPPLDPSNSKRALAPTDALNFVLSSCRTVAEARNALNQVTLVSVNEPAIGFPAPIHLIITEQSGKQLIVEWCHQKIQFYDSKIGVLTNAPEYPWHLTNLRNYVNLRGTPQPSFKLHNQLLAPLGGGNQMLGLPGDFTPPSRFVRAAYFAANARRLPDGAEGIYEIFRILDNFNVPAGAAEGHKASTDLQQRSSTVWTVAYHQKAKKMYFHTQNNRQLQLVDLNKIDFCALDDLIVSPLDDGKQAVLDRTPRF